MTKVFKELPKLREEIKKWEKNRDLLINIASFDLGLKLESPNLILNNLFVKIIEGLQDNDTFITYKGNYYDNWRTIINNFYDLVDKYPDGEYWLKQVKDYNFGKLLHDDIHRYVDKVNSNKYSYKKTSYDMEMEKGYNLIELCIDYNQIDKLYGLIANNISIYGDKFDMINDLFSYSHSNDKIYSVLELIRNYKEAYYMPPTFNYLINDRTDLHNYSINSFENSFKDYDYLLQKRDKKSKFLKNSNVFVLSALQHKNLINFNTVIFNNKGKKIGTPCQIFEKAMDESTSFSYEILEIFYDSNTYLDYSEEIRLNTDNYILNRALELNYPVDYLINLVGFKNFNINDEIVDLIIYYIISKQIGYEEINKICDVIIRKSSDKEEYKQYLRLVKKIKANTNKVELTNERQKLVKTLSKINKN